KLVAAGVIAVMLAIPTGAFLYIHFVEPKAPARLSLSTDTTDGSATSATAAAAGGLSGTWKATPASQVGYRVNEVLFGQVNVAVDLKAQRNGGRFEVNGAIPIAFADWGIPNPTFGPVSTEDHGLLELLIVAERAR